MLENKIRQLEAELTTYFASASDEASLEHLRVQLLGRNGIFSGLMDELKAAPLADKQLFGPRLNALKQQALTLHEKQLNILKKRALEAELETEKFFDVTTTAYVSHTGTLHPLTHFQQKIEDIFISMGYAIVDGPEVETPYYNFEALNIPENHPARDMWDTFWLDLPSVLLRTHTSSVQIHTLQKVKPPLAIVAPGRVFRHEATDATHDFVFHQVEGLFISTKISLSHLLGTLNSFFKALYHNAQLTVRIRPSYFPFVEPGVEVDISCPFCTEGCSICKHSKWLEVGGAGLVHPNVLEFNGIDANTYSGFAFGLGLERLAMLHFGIPDIRYLTNARLEFLRQFP
jgi:phenylalanyl-tRNA synthetase alpha chain